MNEQKEQNEKSTVKGSPLFKAIVIFAICICAILLLSQIEAFKELYTSISSILSPVIMGVIFAYVINPLDKLFENAFFSLFSKTKLKQSTKRRISRGLSVTLSIITLILVIVLLLFLILPELWQSFTKLIERAPSLFESASNWFQAQLSADTEITRNINNYLNQAGETVLEWLAGIAPNAISNVFSSVFGFVFDFLIALVICVYALLEKHKFVAQSKKLIFATLKPTMANDILDIARYSNAVFEKFISGKIITSTIVGILTFLFMSVMSMPYALLSASVIAVTNIIPFFGPFIGGIPTAFIVLVTNPKQGLIYIVFLLVLQQIEGNIIEPMIMEDKTGVSKFWITAALLLIGGVFGLIGMIFSVPFIAVLFYCIRLGSERSLKRKNLPIPSEEYYDVGLLDIETNELREAPKQVMGKKLKETVSDWKNKVTHKEDKKGDSEE